MQLNSTDPYRLNILLAELRTLAREVNTVRAPQVTEGMERIYHLGILRISHQEHEDEAGAQQVTRIQVDTFCQESQHGFDLDADTARFVQSYIFTLEDATVLQFVRERGDMQVDSLNSFNALDHVFARLLRHLEEGLRVIKADLDNKLSFLARMRVKTNA